MCIKEYSISYNILVWDFIPSPILILLESFNLLQVIYSINNTYQ